MRSLNKIDVPDHWDSLTAMIATVSTMVTGNGKMADKLISRMSSMLNMTEKSTNFLRGVYLPELQKATEEINIPFKTRKSLNRKLVATYGKLTLALFWYT